MDKSFLDITGFADVFSRFWRQKNPARFRRFAKKSDPFRKPASGFSCPKGCEGRYCMQSIPLAVLKQKERVLRLSPFVVPAFLCNIYKKAAQASDDACAAFCILWVVTQCRMQSMGHNKPPAMRVEDKRLYQKPLSG